MSVDLPCEHWVFSPSSILVSPTEPQRFIVYLMGVVTDAPFTANIERKFLINK
jgi:hypothetical protein